MARDHLRKRREALGISQSAVAKLAGMKSWEYSRIECGYRDVSPAEAAAIGAALRVDPSHVDKGAPAPRAPLGLATARARAAASSSVTALHLVVNASTSESFPYAHPPVIADPANFGEMPDDRWLARNGTDDSTYRKQIGEAMRYSTVILHTSRIPAKVWSAWRQFEKRAADVLRSTP